MSMMTREWKTLTRKKIDDLEVTLKELMAETHKEIHVGTDSQQDGKVTQFVTVVVLVTPTKGARAFYSREVVPRIKSLRERLLREVSTSVQLGLELTAVLPEETLDMTIHVDANPNIKFKSSDYVQELAGYVAGQGFKTLLKPDSWAATHAADHVVKGMVGRQ